MGGKSGTTTQSVSIPPEVLARYNAVNARAEEVAATPFQPYTGQFVAPLTGQQQAGMANVNAAANMAQPYFNQATSALTGAYNQAVPYYQNSIGSLQGGMSQANSLYGTALDAISNGLNIGSQYGQDATQYFNRAGTTAQPYMDQSGQYVASGLGAASPLMQQSKGFLTGATEAVNPEEFNSAQINKYMSPYMAQVIEAQTKLAEQQNAIQRSALNSQAIGAGAFGGDRSGITQANLAGQQSLAQQATMANLLQSGYGQALGAFQQQQGVNLQAGQANRAAQQFGQQAAANLAQQAFGQNLAASQQYGNLGQALFGQQMAQGQAMQGLGQQLYAQNLGAAQAQSGIAQNQFGMSAQLAAMQQAAAQGLYGMGQQYATGLAGFGTGAQQAALQGAQAQIGAGTLEQQTQQAQLTANYQQFLQERGYPFQVAQFLANIAMGTGALSGSTTTTTQPMPFFSDRSLKKDVKEIGETHDGLPIYSFKYKGGDEQPRIGVMADEAREKHPDAVHRYGGIDAVDYEKIADRASEGGGVMPHRAGQGYAPGGVVSDQDLASIIAMQKEFLGPHGKGGIYGQSQHSLPGGAGIVPQKGVHVARLQSAGAPPRPVESGLGQAIGAVEKAEGLGEKLLGEKGYFGKQGIIRRGANTVKELVSPTSATGQKPETGRQSVPQPASSQPARTAQDTTQDAIKTASLSRPEDELFDFEGSRMAAYGGGIRPAKAQGGYLEEKVLPYQSDLGYGPEDVNEAESKTPIEPLKPGQTPGQSGGSGLGNLASAIGTAGTIAKAGTAVAEFLPALFALLPSDERLKTDMKRVGQLDNGQPVYKYRFGKGPMQLGLSAQNVSEYGDPSAVYRDKDGFLMLDYDRATKNYGGGVRPAFQEGGDAKKEYTLDDYLNSIAKIESGGRYEAVGPRTKSGDRAYGKYQVMGANIPAWSERHLGQRLTPQEFLANEEAQEKIARGEFGSYLNKYGTPEDAASMWFSGRPLAQAGNRADVLGTTVPAYINKFRAGLGLGTYPGSEGEPRRQVAGAESVVEGGRRSDTVDGQRVSSGGLDTPMEYRTGKPFESWGDFATSRQFLIPLLSGLGGMARSKSLYAGSAILEGLGAAAESYAGLERPVTEGEERRGLAATAAETAKKVAQETELLETGLYEKKWIPGVGWWVYDKSKPYDPGKRITDSQMNPIGGVSIDINKIPTAPDSLKPNVGAPGSAPGATSGTQAAPSSGAPATAAPSGPPTGEQALTALNWKPTTDIPQGYVPPNQFNLEMDEASKQREQSIASPMLRDQRNRAGAASRELYRLDEMTQAFNTLPPNGLLTPGQYANERVNFVKSLNTISQVAGGKPLWDPTQVGAAEQLAKDAFRLGQQAASSAGTVAGRDIIEQSVVATPGMELTAAGFRRVAAGMRLAAQYEIDKAKFLDSYSGQWGHLSGAEELFNKLNPPSEYARRAVISTIDPALMQRINAYVAQYKDRPIQEIVAQLAPSIDRLYGTGVTAKILGAK